MERGGLPGVLLVEDDPGLRRSLQILIEDEVGCPVTPAGSGAEALDWLRAGGEFRIVVSDIVMPGLDGLELLCVVRREWPTLEVALMTAFPSVLTPDDRDLIKATTLLDKPIDVDRLLALVRTAVGGEARYGSSEDQGGGRDESHAAGRN